MFGFVADVSKLRAVITVQTLSQAYIQLPGPSRRYRRRRGLICREIGAVAGPQRYGRRQDIYERRRPGASTCHPTHTLHLAPAM